MKKKLSLLLALVLSLVCISFPFNASAEGIISNSQTNIEYFADGSYLVKTIVITDNQTMNMVGLAATASTKTGRDTVTYYSNSGVAQFSLSVTGTFTYNGSTSTCTAASHSTQIFNSDWYVSSASSYRSGSRAYADGTFKRDFLFITVDTRDIHTYLDCSPTGVLS